MADGCASFEEEIDWHQPTDWRRRHWIQMSTIVISAVVVEQGTGPTYLQYLQQLLRLACDSPYSAVRRLRFVGCSTPIRLQWGRIIVPSETDQSEGHVAPGRCCRQVSAISKANDCQTGANHLTLKLFSDWSVSERTIRPY